MLPNLFDFNFRNERLKRVLGSGSHIHFMWVYYLSLLLEVKSILLGDGNGSVIPILEVSLVPSA